MGHLGCFQFLDIKNKAHMNIIEHMPLWHGKASFGSIYKSGIAGSSGRYISNFLRKLQIDFQSGCMSLPIPPAMDKCSSFSTSLATFVFT